MLEGVFLLLVNPSVGLVHLGGRGPLLLCHKNCGRFFIVKFFYFCQGLDNMCEPVQKFRGKHGTKNVLHFARDIASSCSSSRCPGDYENF